MGYFLSPKIPSHLRCVIGKMTPVVVLSLARFSLEDRSPYEHPYKLLAST
jgi:hypothetical protein